MRYDYESKTNSTLYSEYVHSPNDIRLSILDYLEAKLGEGWALLSHSGTGDGNNYFVFEAFTK